MRIFDLFDFNSKLEVMDVGAAAIAEEPIYKGLVDMEVAHLTAFDGDERQMKKLQETYGKKNVSCFNSFLFDGKVHDVYLCEPLSGMTSLFKPKKDALKFFNGFSKFGQVGKIDKIKTTRLDDVQNLKKIDFLKMDAQGAELEILQNGRQTLEECLAIQLEVSFFALYENQPSFGDIDIYMRKMGFVPHRILDLKRWSIAPIIFNDNIRSPGNQVLESDIIYIKDPLLVKKLTDIQLQKITILAHYAFRSIDYCAFLLIEMEKRKLLYKDSHKQYITNLKSFE